MTLKEMFSKYTLTTGQSSLIDFFQIARNCQIYRDKLKTKGRRFYQDFNGNNI